MPRVAITVFVVLAFLSPQLFFGPIANSQDAEAVAAAAKPSIGVIIAERPDGVFSGSAFMAADRLVLTSYHVVEGARRILLKFPDYPPVEPRVVGSNGNDDVAVLSIPGLPVRPLPLGDISQVHDGQTIVVIGFPRIEVLGTQTSTVTQGIVSAIRPGLLQVQAPISPGNSGGPVLNLRGEVIGVVRATLRGEQQGLNFATQINAAKPLLGSAILSSPPPSLPAPSPQPTAPSIPTSSPPGTAAISHQKATVKRGDLVYTLASDKIYYEAEEPVDLTLTITNTGSEDVRLDYATSQQYDFVIMRGDTEVTKWSLGQTFTGGSLHLALAPGKSFVYNTRWLQKDQDKRFVPPGRYVIIGISPAIDNEVKIILIFQKLR